VVLMDIQMPEMDGFACTKAIREQEKTTGAHLPLVAVTAHAMKGDRDRCLAAGYDAYLTKPMSLPELLSTVRLVLPAEKVSSQSLQHAQISSKTLSEPSPVSL